MMLLIHGPPPLMDPVPSTPHQLLGLVVLRPHLKLLLLLGKIVEHAPIDVSVGPVFSVNMPPRVPCSLPPCYPTDGSGHSYSSGVLISEVADPQGNGETLSEVKTPSASNDMVLYSSGGSKERAHVEEACPISSRIEGGDMSFWMEEKLLNFGKFLGVSVEGKEDRVLELLREIEQQSLYEGTGRELGKGVKQNNLGDVVVYQRRGRVCDKEKGTSARGVGKWGLLLLMEVKILSWNVRGMNDPNKRAIIKVGVREWGANLVCFQETKMEVLSDAIVRSVWGGSWVKYDWVPAVGSAGGILLMWDDRSLEVKEIGKGVFSLAALVKDRVSGVEWGFGGVYGPVGERVQGVFLGRTGQYYGGMGHSMGSRGRL
ncbi:uncharacterized protein LOC107772940 [Nicotiana tabacum]|uniref:Uncharacterized protein LOC107772940 n=1 Tax=Nicotiana tabacum TaxID=4097 RepID=A0A1S3Y7B6_TOBAC